VKSGWTEVGPKFAHVIKEREPSGRHRRYIVRIYLRGEHRTNILFRSFVLAKMFAVLLDLSTAHGTTKKGSRR